MWTRLPGQTRPDRKHSLINDLVWSTSSGLKMDRLKLGSGVVKYPYEVVQVNLGFVQMQ